MCNVAVYHSRESGRFSIVDFRKTLSIAVMTYIYGIYCIHKCFENRIDVCKIASDSEEDYVSYFRRFFSLLLCTTDVISLVSPFHWRLKSSRSGYTAAYNGDRRDYSGKRRKKERRTRFINGFACCRRVSVFTVLFLSF